MRRAAVLLAVAVPAVCGSADYREEHHPAHVVEYRGDHVVTRRQPEVVTRIWGLAGDVALAELIASTSYPRELAAIGAVESGYDPQAVGSRGERGIYQVRPDIWGPVPQNRDEAVAAIARIGHHQRERERLKHDMDDQITRIREQYDALIQHHAEEIKALSEGVQTWAEANRAELTQGGRIKSANLMTGEIRWRMTPPSCRLVRVKEALEELKQRMLDRFIRQKEEVNKEAILADPEAVADCRWIEITQHEDFVIVPFETNLEEVA